MGCYLQALALVFWSWAPGLDMSALLSCVNMRQKCTAASLRVALLCGGMHVICRFQLHIIAAPGSAVFYGFYGFNERGHKLIALDYRVPCSLRVIPSVFMWL